MAVKALQVTSVARWPQEFMHVYDTLRDELVADPLTAGQPHFAADHLKRVGQDASLLALASCSEPLRLS